MKLLSVFVTAIIAFVFSLSARAQGIRVGIEAGFSGSVDIDEFLDPNIGVSRFYIERDVFGR